MLTPGKQHSPFNTHPTPSLTFHFHQQNLLLPSAASTVIAECQRVFHTTQIDILANVAGIMDTCSSVDNMTDAVYEPVMKVNLTVPMQLMRGVINEGGMKTRQIGVIINIASRAALGGAAFGAA